MTVLTPAEQYAAGLPVFERGVAALLADEEDAEASLEAGVTGVLEAIAMIATAYVERAQAVQGEREAAEQAAVAMNHLASFLDLEPEHAVPPSRAAISGPAAAVYRATSRGVPAVVFELASIAASRAAREL